MTTKKKAITNDAKYREDFDKAVDAEVELKLKSILAGNGEKDTNFDLGNGVTAKIVRTKAPTDFNTAVESRLKEIEEYDNETMDRYQKLVDKYTPKNSAHGIESVDKLRARILQTEAIHGVIDEFTNTDPFEGLTASQHINPKNIDKDNTDLFFNVGNKPGGVYATSLFPPEVKRHYDKMMNEFGSFPITPAMTGQPSTQFHSRTSETMAYIANLSDIVDEFIDALSPVLVPNQNNAEKVPVPTNDTISSEFDEFLSCAERRIDSIRAKISEAMVRRTI